MKVLVGCEFSGRVRQAFRSLGHDAWSCDLLPAEDGSLHHIQGDVLAVLGDGWDLGIFHVPCTYLALCQAWRKSKPGQEWRAQEEVKAVDFARACWMAPIPRIALENPKSRLSTLLAPKSQTIHPWQFGHGERKETWLWLRNLPLLVSTNVVDGREEKVWRMPPGENRWKDRSRTYPGIAEAMAKQWGVLS